MSSNKHTEISTAVERMVLLLLSHGSKLEKNETNEIHDTAMCLYFHLDHLQDTYTYAYLA